MNVTHVVLTLDVGGLEQVVLRLIEQGRQAGDHVSVLCICKPGALAREAESLGATVVAVGKGPGLKLSAIGKTRQELMRLRPDVVHSHQIGALFYAGSGARKNGVPAIVHTEHGIHFENRARTRWLGKWAARSVQRYFCVSRDVANSVIANQIVPKQKVFVIDNGIDVDQFMRPVDRDEIRRTLGIPPSALVIGTVGRLEAVKNHELLLRAFARLPAVGGELPHLVLVGDGTMKNGLLQMALDGKIDARTHLVGYQPEPQRFLRVMDVFALTSRSEGMPMSVLEAWASGVPVVSSSVGGVPDLISDGQTGLLFPSGDEAALTGILTKLLADENRRRALATAASRDVRAKYDASVMAENYRRHYAELLGQRPNSPRQPESEAVELKR